MVAKIEKIKKQEDHGVEVMKRHSEENLTKMFKQKTKKMKNAKAIE
jgi:hypothetical protein